MSKSQNIFDNQEFFDGYKKIRNNRYSANNLEEKPALFSLAPDLTGKAVLDLGCGYGENCAEFKARGATSALNLICVGYRLKTYRTRISIRRRQRNISLTSPTRSFTLFIRSKEKETTHGFCCGSDC